MIKKKARLEPRRKVFVGMSGGVDSSVAALLLKKEGYDVVGVFIRSYNLDGCADRDAEDARRVAEKLQIPFYVFDFEDEYKKKVVEYMIDGYRKGLTPNPDVMCNKEIKFGIFLKKALEMGAEYVATGHYIKNKKSKIKNQNDNSKLKIVYTLFEARDKNKDQSYFLWTLTQDQLKHCLFPIGDYLKSEVREIAREAGLPTAEKKDSQGICFLGKVTLEEFLGNYIPSKRGKVLSANGEVIGEHRGAEFYTIGQRHIGLANRGLTRTERGLTQTKDFKPLYVAGKDVVKNTLVLAEGDDNPALSRKEIELQNINFIDPKAASLIRALARRSLGEGGNGGIRILARVRYRQPLVSAKLVTSELGNYKLEFDSPVKFVAPGQSAVFYLPGAKAEGRGMQVGGGKLEVIGGGVIV